MRLADRVNAPIRLLISDIDGTLVRPDRSLAKPVAVAVRRLRAAGVEMSVISARPLSGMLKIAATLGIDGPIGAFNGGTIARPDGRIISAERLKAEIVVRALQLFDQPWVTPWLFADGRWYAKNTDAPHMASQRITAAQEPTIVGEFTGFLDRVDKLVAVSDEADRLASLDTETATALGDGAAVARSQAYFLDVTAPLANKGAGVTAIAAGFDIPLANTAVIGDGGNDIQMFEVAGFSVAMGNGSDAVRAAADETTSTNAEDGVAEAIDRLILPRVGAPLQ